MDTVEKLNVQHKEKEDWLINIVCVCQESQKGVNDEIEVEAGELVIPFDVSEKWLWVRSSNSIGVYPRSYLERVEEGRFFEHPIDNKCPFCRITVTKISYATHVREFPSGNCLLTQKCEKCLKPLKNKRSLKKHKCKIVNLHNYTCPYCAKKFQRRSNLSKHLRENICMPSCFVCKNICNSCNSKKEYSHIIFQKMDELDNSLKAKDIEQVYNEGSISFFEMLKVKKNFSSFIKYMRNTKFNSRLIWILLEVIDKRIMPFKALKDENVITLLITCNLFSIASIDVHLRIQEVLLSAWGLKDCSVLNGFEGLRDYINKDQYEPMISTSVVDKEKQKLLSEMDEPETKQNDNIIFLNETQQQFAINSGLIFTDENGNLLNYQVVNDPDDQQDAPDDKQDAPMVDSDEIVIDDIENESDDQLDGPDDQLDAPKDAPDDQQDAPDDKQDAPMVDSDEIVIDDIENKSDDQLDGPDDQLDAPKDAPDDKQDAPMVDSDEIVIDDIENESDDQLDGPDDQLDAPKDAPDDQQDAPDDQLDAPDDKQDAPIVDSDEIVIDDIENKSDDQLDGPDDQLDAPKDAPDDKQDAPMVDSDEIVIDDIENESDDQLDGPDDQLDAPKDAPDDQQDAPDDQLDAPDDKQDAPIVDSDEIVIDDIENKSDDQLDGPDDQLDAPKDAPDDQQDAPKDAPNDQQDAPDDQQDGPKDAPNDQQDAPDDQQDAPKVGPKGAGNKRKLVGDQTDGTTKKKKKKPQMCPNCGRLLSQRTALRNHMNVCLGLKPFKCNLCEKAFAQPNGLKYHLNSEHKENV
ncbi:uncharacterized protein LOC120415687 isoform X2 [Culex pipiens pallens]|uniref:uncharacterized protein LOC120415687 isoform X2 n=1 Tax=Culex pipiens pallens TaxID=42434 RepID=UPI00195361F2|nr:uncharacterized protein LOC120415687 isoform X2 [Culex pipiens pallens]